MRDEDREFYRKAHIAPCELFDEWDDAAVERLSSDVQRVLDGQHTDVDEQATIATLNGKLMEADRTIRNLGGIVFILGTLLALIVTCKILWWA